MNTIAEQLLQVREKIRLAAAQSNRNPNSVKLLAVSKTFAVEAIDAAYSEGQRCFGENYVQELQQKAEHFADRDDIEWHFIGPLQSNKSKIIAQYAHWMHTLDRQKIAQRLSDQRPANMPPLQVLIQVNISDDPNKSGVTLDQVPALAEQVAQLPNLTLRGLMAIPAVDLDDHTLLAQYRQLAQLQSSLAATYKDCNEVSIGMSQDMAVAIAAGATYVRIGTAIFGTRTKVAD